MAKDLTISEERLKTARTRVSCNHAQQCLWFEAPNSYSTTCSNRDSLVCQKHCEEVFRGSELGDLNTATN